jgi:hypothetical protein
VKPHRILPLALLAAPFVCLALWADDDKEKKNDKSTGPLTLIDQNDKKYKVNDAEWLSGTRRLGWLATGEEKPKDKPKKGKQAEAGPLAYALREASEIHYAAGVLTLIPVERLRSLSIDAEKKTLTVKAIGDKGEAVSLEGTTEYTDINWFSLEADVDMGDCGTATLKFQGGRPKGNVKSIEFTKPAKVEEIKGGRSAVVKTADKSVKQTHKVSDLTPLYKTKGGERTHPQLMFRKTLKLDVGKMESITDASEDTRDVVWKVKMKGGEERTLTLILNTTINEEAAELVGFVGKVPVGYLLIPVKRVKSVLFDASEAPPDNQLPPPLVEKADDKDEKKDK